jgi:hypothetical protein
LSSVLCSFCCKSNLEKDLRAMNPLITLWHTVISCLT